MKNLCIISIFVSCICFHLCICWPASVGSVFSAPVVYAASDDAEDYDYEEIYEDETASAQESTSESTSESAASTASESTSAPAANTASESTSVSTASTAQQSNPTAPTGTQHILDTTPKTSQLHPDKKYIFCVALFFAGIALLLTSGEKQQTHQKAK